jgi:hypothetical protein
MLPITSGGIPPSGDDFNGLFYDYSSHIVWINAGGQYRFDAALSMAMGGYPKDMVLQSNDGNGSYRSLIDNNTNDFNSDPTQIGVTWAAYSGAAFGNAPVSTTGGNTALSAVQAIADMITVTGTLTSNATLTFPAARGKFIVVNQTTGNFTLTALPSGGSGVQIKQGFADAIYCDGANIGYQQASAANRNPKDNSRSIANTAYADRAADRVGGGYQDSGVANAYVIATVPASTAPADFQTVRFRALNQSNGGACTLDIGGGPLPLICGDGSNPRFGDISNTAVTTATYIAALNKWIVNGLIVPDILISNAIWVSGTRTLQKGNFNFYTGAGSYGCNLNSTPSVGDAIYGADPVGTWRTNPLTIASTGGILIGYTDINGALQTMSSLVADIKGWRFQLTYDGTYWRLS